MRPTPAITVSSLTKRYGRHEAVGDLTFSVPAGRVTGFLGPNGAGKTTTIRMVLGLVRPSAGTARVAGVPFAELANPASTVGILIEGAQAHPGRTALEHLEILARERAVDRSRIAPTLDRVQLAGVGHRKVGGFSLGMRQRLDLVAALLGEPEILILDEPANGLDQLGSAGSGSSSARSRTRAARPRSASSCTSCPPGAARSRTSSSTSPTTATTRRSPHDCTTARRVAQARHHPDVHLAAGRDGSGGRSRDLRDHVVDVPAPVAHDDADARPGRVAARGAGGLAISRRRDVG